jgi:catechol 2,3-dioxygenase-like lactoylglutathione lyase family enzyme
MSDKYASLPLGAWHHVGLTVSDIERSVRFYCDLLGFILVKRRLADADYLGRQTGYPGVRLEVASLRLGPAMGPTLELARYVTQAGPAADPATNRPGTSHLCFEVDHIQAVYESLRARGVPFRTAPVPITAGPNQGGFGVYLSDPDGYTIELFQAPRSASPTATKAEEAPAADPNRSG